MDGVGGEEELMTVVRPTPSTTAAAAARHGLGPPMVSLEDTTDVDLVEVGW